MFYTMIYDSPVGKLTIAGREDNIVGLWIEGQKYFGGTLPEGAVMENKAPVLQKAAGWLDRYFAGERPLPGELTLSPEGGEFRQAVWKILCEIPYGEVTTYKEIAQKLAVQKGIASMSAQAVGGAVGRNPISIIIPCHRVVGTNGSLTGYAAGIQVKQMLLSHERINLI